MIVVLNRKELKQEAKSLLREVKPQPYLVTFVFLLIGFLLEILSKKLEYPGVTFQQFFNSFFDDNELMKILTASSQRGFFSRVLSIAISMMNVMLSSGFALYCLNVSRKEAASIGNLFDTFANFLRIFCLDVLVALFTALWSILFVIPGIIAAYRYSFAIFIMLDHPDMNPMDCIRKSKELTNGHKMELFVLDLSFLGWIFLSAIPFVSLFTIPFMTVTHAIYYRMIADADSAANVDNIGDSFPPME